MMDEDMYEVIDIEEENSENENLSDDEDDRDLPIDIEEASSQNDDAAYVFRGHAQSKNLFNSGIMQFINIHNEVLTFLSIK